MLVNVRHSHSPTIDVLSNPNLVNHIPQPLHPVTVPARSTPSDSTEGSSDPAAPPVPASADQSSTQENTTDNPSESSPERPSGATTPNNRETDTQDSSMPVDTNPSLPNSSMPETGNQTNRDMASAIPPADLATAPSNVAPSSNGLATSSQASAPSTLLPANEGEYSEKTDALLPTNEPLHTARLEETTSQTTQAMTDVA
jgi:hypothetical protein